MFTGIVETTGTVEQAVRIGGNLDLVIRSPLSSGLHVNQSVSHNGCCLTVTAVHGGTHTVSLIDESLRKTTFGGMHAGDRINLERAMPADGRLDGHIVQGHVDTVCVCERREEGAGSVRLFFTHPADDEYITVPKGSVCVDGVSLTVVDSAPGRFSVAVIPYTLDHTTRGAIKAGEAANVEFDILGKYIRRLMQSR